MQRRLVPDRYRQARRLYSHVRYLGRQRRRSRRISREREMRAIAGALMMLAASTGMAAPPEYFPAPFSSAVRVGDVLYLSGQIGRSADGKLPDAFDGQAKQVMENIGAILKAHG